MTKENLEELHSLLKKEEDVEKMARIQRKEDIEKERQREREKRRRDMEIRRQKKRERARLGLAENSDTQETYYTADETTNNMHRKDYHENKEKIKWKGDAKREISSGNEGDYEEQTEDEPVSHTKGQKGSTKQNDDQNEYYISDESKTGNKRSQQFKNKKHAQENSHEGKGEGNGADASRGKENDNGTYYSSENDESQHESGYGKNTKGEKMEQEKESGAHGADETTAAYLTNIEGHGDKRKRTEHSSSQQHASEEEEGEGEGEGGEGEKKKYGNNHINNIYEEMEHKGKGESTTSYSDSESESLSTESIESDDGQEKQNEHKTENVPQHQVGNRPTQRSANYYFSVYNSRQREKILNNNFTNLEKMLGNKFTKKMKSYCSSRNISIRFQGTYFDVSMKYSKYLESLRQQFLKHMISKGSVKNANKSTLLHVFLNKNNLSTAREEINSAMKNIYNFRDQEEHKINIEFNDVLQEYICHIFIQNPGKDTPEKLYNFSKIMGFFISEIRSMNSPDISQHVRFAHNLFLISSNNIFLLGHLLVLSLAHYFYNDVFVARSRAFYTFEEMVLENSDMSFFMLNEMCLVLYQEPKYSKKDITFIPRNLRKGRKTQGISSEAKIICDTLEIVMNAIQSIHHYELKDVLHNSGLTVYENSVSFTLNALRIFSDVCPKDNSTGMLRCTFEQSSLFNEKLDKMVKNIKARTSANTSKSTDLANSIDPEENGTSFTLMRKIENQKRLRTAFNLLQIYMNMENHLTDKDTSSFYIKLIMEQNTYVTWYKYLFWYEDKHFINLSNPLGTVSKKGSKRFLYNEYLKLQKSIKQKYVPQNLHFEVGKDTAKVYYYMYDEALKKQSNFYSSGNNSKLLNKIKKKRELSQINSFWDNVFYFRNFLLFNSPVLTKVKSNLMLMMEHLTYIEKKANSPMNILVRGNNFIYITDVVKNDNLFFINLFLMNFFSSKNPVAQYYKQERDFYKNTLAEKFASSTSMFIPNKLRRLVVHLKKGGLKKKLYIALAKVKILQHMPPQLFENITSSILFTTHTIADMQFNQSALQWNISEKIKNRDDKDFAKKIFTKGGFVGYIEELFSKWAKVGFEESKTKEIVNFKKKVGLEKSIQYETTADEEESKKLQIEDEHSRKQIEAEKIDTDSGMLAETSFFLNENDQWDHYVIKELIRSYEIWLSAKSTQVLKEVDFVYQIVADSKHMLESHIEDTILFARTAKPVKQTAFGNFFKRIISLGNMLLRRPTFKVQHAVWFGAVINIRQVFIVLEKLNELQKLLKNETESWLMKEAFIELVQHVVDISTDKHLREPFGTRRNPGMMAIRPDYATLPEEERKKEFQKSMCADHCTSIWLLMVNFALDHLKNPDSLIKYEKTFSQHKFANAVTDKNFANNFKMILGNDALLHFFNTLLPKKAKKDIKAMEYGAAVNFAFLLKLVRVIFSQMDLPALAQMYYMQGPYFGHFIGRWKKNREESRRKEILGFLTLGSLSFLTFLNTMDIVQHANDIGMGPQETCYFREIPPGKVCSVKVATKALTNSAEVAMKSVFSVGIFAAMGPALFIPMAGVAVWSILKSEFQVLQRIDMAIGSVFKNMFRKFLSSKGVKKLKSVFRRKNIIKNKIMENAESKLEQMKNQPAKNGKKRKMDTTNLLKGVHRYSGSKAHHISYATLTT